jgi:hypothetical protein
MLIVVSCSFYIYAAHNAGECSVLNTNVCSISRTDIALVDRHMLSCTYYFPLAEHTVVGLENCFLVCRE